MYTDIFLKFDSGTQAENELQTRGIDVNCSSGVLPNGVLYNLDVVFCSGAVFKPSGQKIMIDGDEYDEMIQTPGYHLNMRIHGDVPDFGSFKITPDPEIPKCVFG